VAEEAARRAVLREPEGRLDAAELRGEHLVRVRVRVKVRVRVS